MPTPTPTPNPFQPRIAAIRAQMMALVQDAAAAYGQLRMHVHYGDNYWTVTVYPDGATKYENYAEENRGANAGRVEDLATWELVSLVSGLEG